MHIFSLLLIKILPLYGLIAGTFVIGKIFKINRDYIAKLLIYLIVPILIFSTVATAKLTLGNVSLPVTFFLTGTLISLFMFQVGKLFWRDNTGNLLAFSSGTAATGYFGVPIAMALFSKEMVSLAVLTTIGIILFENSVGFYYLSRGRHSVKQSLVRLLKMPAIWAFALAALINILKIDLGSQFINFSGVVKDVYVFFGMSMIGLSLASLKKYKFDFSFLILSYITKFIIWPALILLIIAFDKAFFHIFSAENYQILILMSLVPVAVNTVAYATELKAHPEKAAMAILTSILIALFYIPLMLGLLIK